MKEACERLNSTERKAIAAIFVQHFIRHNMKHEHEVNYPNKKKEKMKLEEKL